MNNHPPFREGISPTRSVRCWCGYRGGIPERFRVRSCHRSPRTAPVPSGKVRALVVCADPPASAGRGPLPPREKGLGPSRRPPRTLRSASGRPRRRPGEPRVRPPSWPRAPRSRSRGRWGPYYPSYWPILPQRMDATSRPCPLIFRGDALGRASDCSSCDPPARFAPPPPGPRLWR